MEPELEGIGPAHWAPVGAVRGVNMQLNQFTDYALRVLVYCALENGRVARTSDVAHAFGISENHLTKVAQQLAVHGFLVTQRGRGGGLKLARPANEIAVGDVVRRLETNMNLVECFDADRNCCPIAPACRFNQALQRALEAFFLVLDSYTLADLVGCSDQLRPLLRLDQRRAAAAQDEVSINSRSLATARSGASP